MKIGINQHADRNYSDGLSLQQALEIELNHRGITPPIVEDINPISAKSPIIAYVEDKNGDHFCYRVFRVQGELCYFQNM